jgi:hypothetical protein
MGSLFALIGTPPVGQFRQNNQFGKGHAGGVPLRRRSKPQVNRTYGEMAGKRCKRYDESRSVKLSLGAQLRSNTLHFGQDFRVAGGIDRQPPTQ